MLPIIVEAAQDEAYGVVTNVVDGDTFDVTIEKADSKIASAVERIRLADVNSPELSTPDGPSAMDFTFAVLMNKRVYLMRHRLSPPFLSKSPSIHMRI